MLPGTSRFAIYMYPYAYAYESIAYAIFDASSSHVGTKRTRTQVRCERIIKASNSHHVFASVTKERGRSKTNSIDRFARKGSFCGKDKPGSIEAATSAQ